MRQLASWVIGAISCTAIAGCSSSQEAKVTDAPGSTWSQQSLPDFSGWWEWQYTDAHRPRGPRGEPMGLPIMALKAPLKPEIIAAIVEDYQDVFASKRERKSLGAGQLCLPPYFIGTNGGAANLFEVLLTPGRVTIIDEMGLVRRAAVGQPLPPRIVATNSGTSVANWEGSTLVIETVGVNPERTYYGRFRLGKDVRVVERFRLVEKDLLEISTEVTAPAIFTGPFRDTFQYRRRIDHQPVDGLTCAEGDRSIDHSTGAEQLDLAPPADLPPPPAD